MDSNLTWLLGDGEKMVPQVLLEAALLLHDFCCFHCTPKHQ